MEYSPPPIRVAQIMGKWVGGGVEAVVMNYYRHIDRSKIQFDFICDEDSTNIPYDEIDKLGGRVILVPPYQKIFQYQRQLNSVLVDEKYKIVHSHINTLSVFPLFSAKYAEVPIRIAHSHATSNKKEWKRNFIKKILRPFSKTFATHYMACSEIAGRWLFGNHAYDKKLVKILNNAIDLESFKFNKDIRNTLRKEYEIGNDKKILGNIGRMVETKNQLFLLKLLEGMLKYENCLLIIIGQGPLEETLKNKSIELGIQDRVIFPGQCGDIYNWYQVFDVFILPSLYEGFGMTLLEAQTSNLPCITSTGVPYSTKLIDNFRFVSLDEDNSVWEKNIKELYAINDRKSNVDEFRKLGFDINKEANNLCDYYLGLLGGNKDAQN